MKTVIVYQSKRGATKKVAQYVHQNVKDSFMYEVGEYKRNDFDHYIIMSPVYYGQINKSIKTFFEEYRDELLQKKLSIVLVSMNKKGYEEVININFDQELQDHANFIQAGGAYDFKKMNFLERFIVKKLTKVHQSLEDINYQNLDILCGDFT